MAVWLDVQNSIILLIMQSQMQLFWRWSCLNAVKLKINYEVIWQSNFPVVFPGHFCQVFFYILQTI